MEIMTDKSEFWAEEGEVLLHKRTRELYHVTLRLWDVDHENSDYPEWARHYCLYDDRHTSKQYWPEEDLVDCFMKIGQIVSGKPIQSEELINWYNHD